MRAQLLAVCSITALVACAHAASKPAKPVPPVAVAAATTKPGAAAASYLGIWSDTFDNIDGSGHRIEITKSQLHYARPDIAVGAGWFIEEPYTRRDDGLLVLGRPAAIDDAKNACEGEMGIPVCEVPELACVRVNAVTADQIKLSFGMACSDLGHHFNGKRSE